MRSNMRIDFVKTFMDMHGRPEFAVIAEFPRQAIIEAARLQIRKITHRLQVAELRPLDCGRIAIAAGWHFRIQITLNPPGTDDDEARVAGLDGVKGLPQFGDAREGIAKIERCLAHADDGRADGKAGQIGILAICFDRVAGIGYAPPSSVRHHTADQAETPR